jgi:hypothetical protein
LNKNPGHANGVLGMARIKADIVQGMFEKSDSDAVRDVVQESMEYYEKAVQLVKEVRYLFGLVYYYSHFILAFTVPLSSLVLLFLNT